MNILCKPVARKVIAEDWEGVGTDLAIGVCPSTTMVNRLVAEVRMVDANSRLANARLRLSDLGGFSRLADDSKTRMMRGHTAGTVDQVAKMST